MGASVPTSGARRARVGIVLGAGGTLGAAWMAGALQALQDRLDHEVGDADIMIGTSAGSVLTAALRHGVRVPDLVAHQRGEAGTLPSLAEVDRASAPTLPHFRLGSPHLLARATVAPHRVHPHVAASALAPLGRGQLRALESFVNAIPGARRSSSNVVAWPSRATWIVAVDYQSGRRVAFGRAGMPTASLAEAVVASCSIPGWFAPKEINRRRYVDGGVHSAASVDLLAMTRLDRVYVLAPMASHETDRPRGAAHRTERFLRRYVARYLDYETTLVRATGAHVTLLMPGPDDLAAIGINLMDSTRRRLVLETALHTTPARLASLERRR